MEWKAQRIDPRKGRECLKFIQGFMSMFSNSAVSTLRLPAELTLISSSSFLTALGSPSALKMQCC